MANQPKLKYFWRGKKRTAREILETLHGEGKCLSLTLATFRGRLKKVRGKVSKAINYEPMKNARVPIPIKCPDGKMRVPDAIAKHLGISKSCWVSRRARMSLKKAWDMGASKECHINKMQGKVYTKVKKLSPEQLRQKKALDAMSRFNATEYEMSL